MADDDDGNSNANDSNNNKNNDNIVNYSLSSTFSSLLVYKRVIIMKNISKQSYNVGRKTEGWKRVPDHAGGKFWRESALKICLRREY